MTPSYRSHRSYLRLALRGELTGLWLFSWPETYRVLYGAFYGSHVFLSCIVQIIVRQSISECISNRFCGKCETYCSRSVLSSLAVVRGPSFSDCCWSSSSRTTSEEKGGQNSVLENYCFGDPIGEFEVDPGGVVLSFLPPFFFLVDPFCSLLTLFELLELFELFELLELLLELLLLFLSKVLLLIPSGLWEDCLGIFSICWSARSTVPAAIPSARALSSWFMRSNAGFSFSKKLVVYPMTQGRPPENVSPWRNVQVLGPVETISKKCSPARIHLWVSRPTQRNSFSLATRMVGLKFRGNLSSPWEMKTSIWVPTKSRVFVIFRRGLGISMLTMNEFHFW